MFELELRWHTRSLGTCSPSTQSAASLQLVKQNSSHVGILVLRQSTLSLAGGSVGPAPVARATCMYSKRRRALHERAGNVLLSYIVGCASLLLTHLVILTEWRRHLARTALVELAWTDREEPLQFTSRIRAQLAASRDRFRSLNGLA
ncbi:hypothetical protein B0H14DRAFT_2580972 [Mycena olivaceomarginata]|nr:hypothetical protein B0H14DRAFT_2580972 [Mycena olivaceomarginata]